MSDVSFADFDGGGSAMAAVRHCFCSFAAARTCPMPSRHIVMTRICPAIRTHSGSAEVGVETVAPVPSRPDIPPIPDHPAAATPSDELTRDAVIDRLIDEGAPNLLRTDWTTSTMMVRPRRTASVAATPPRTTLVTTTAICRRPRARPLALRTALGSLRDGRGRPVFRGVVVTVPLWDN